MPVAEQSGRLRLRRSALMVRRLILGLRLSLGPAGGHYRWPADLGPERSPGYRVVVVAALCFQVALAAFLPTIADAQEDAAEYVGTDTCKSCHVQAGENWAHTVHAQRSVQIPGTPEAARGCEACHGPGSRHPTNPADKSTILRYSATSVQPIVEQNARCLQCHSGGQRLHWPGSMHERADLACSDCHNPMARFSNRGLLANNTINETCFACHQRQRAEFNRRSRMPLPEGKLSCVDCHNPHGGITDPLLKTVRVNDTCFECHAEKRGPFLWEHAPVRDSCLNCHRAHGSNHDMLLDAPRPLLCQQCHSQLGHPNDLMTRDNLPGGNRPDARLIGRSCTNCHVQIHGSNHPSGLKFHR